MLRRQQTFLYFLPLTLRYIFIRIYILPPFFFSLSLSLSLTSLSAGNSWVCRRKRGEYDVVSYLLSNVTVSQAFSVVFCLHELV